MEAIANAEAFKSYIESIKSKSGYKDAVAFGICRVDYGQLDTSKVLQANYPVVNWNENFGSAAVFADALAQTGVDVDFTGTEFIANVSFAFLENAMAAFAPYLEEAYGDAHKNVQAIASLYEIAADSGMRDGEFKVVFLFENAAPQSVEAVYLKLYALSLSKAELRTVNLDGAFGKLPNVAWSSGMPIELDWLRENEIDLKFSGAYPEIDFVDKFPRFLQHIIPADNTRILETSKVRFGAQVHAGTTVMPGASYINFNAGTTGPVMVEGRISSSAIVGAGSDVGGGASILGVLSGTDGNPISIGENTLLGANSTCGIPLGDGCIIDAGLAILEGTKISIAAAEVTKIKKVNDMSIDDKELFKGKELAGVHGVHFRQDSQTGAIIGRRSTREIKLNADLH
jgi:2,3,4,5-tetrahydropyridine-2,6-dicarboxylate N-succinyltransferase